MSENLISKEKAYEVLTEYYHHKTELQHKALREALDMVPSAELQPTCNQLATSCNQLATDCISRQAAIDAMWELRRVQQMLDDTQRADKVMRGIFLSEQKIKELPSVDIDLSDYSDRLWRNAYEQGKADAESERKRGKWVPKLDDIGFTYGECSECGMINYAGHTNFCPNCGAEMEKGEDDAEADLCGRVQKTN